MERELTESLVEVERSDVTTTTDVLEGHGKHRHLNCKNVSHNVHPTIIDADTWDRTMNSKPAAQGRPISCSHSRTLIPIRRGER